jgi:hypothetical protein
MERGIHSVISPGPLLQNYWGLEVAQPLLSWQEEKNFGVRMWHSVARYGD